MTETNEPDRQQPPGTAQPGTAVPAAVDPDAVDRAEVGRDAIDPDVSPEPAVDTIGADTPGRANTTEKDPSEWVTGDEPMTGAQRSYLDTLARQAGEQLPADLTKAEASEHIDRLQRQTGRGAPGDD